MSFIRLGWFKPKIEAEVEAEGEERLGDRTKATLAESLSLDLGSHDHIDFFWGYGYPDEVFDGAPPIPWGESPKNPQFQGMTKANDAQAKFTIGDEWINRKPLPPKSALYRPPLVRLSRSEEIAEAISSLLVDVELKPELKKKLALRDGFRERRVWFDPDGKMHDAE